MVTLKRVWFQPTHIISSCSSLPLLGIKGDNSLLNEGFLQAKPEKPVTSQKPRSHFPTPAPVSAGRQCGTTCGDLLSHPPRPRAFAQAAVSAQIPDHRFQASVPMPFPRGTHTLGSPSGVSFVIKLSLYLVAQYVPVLQGGACPGCPCVNTCMCGPLLLTSL